jgi:hypothetical protein
MAQIESTFITSNTTKLKITKKVIMKEREKLNTAMRFLEWMSIANEEIMTKRFM